MSIYAYLTCPEARELIFLGKAVWTTTADGEKRVSYFHRGPEEAPPTEERTAEPCRLEILGRNTGKELKVLLEDDLLMVSTCALVEIRGRTSLSRTTWARDWPGSNLPRSIKEEAAVRHA